MTAHDIGAVSTLHMATLPTAMARIGNPYLSLLYREILHNKPLHTALVAVENSHIVGVITATNALHKTQDIMLRNVLRPVSLRTVWTALLKHRVTIGELLLRVWTEHQILRHFPSPYSTILTFFVDTAHQRRGIGTLLLSSLEKRIPKKSSLYVDTEISNVSAREWYGTHGFRKITEISDSIIFKR